MKLQFLLFIKDSNTTLVKVKFLIYSYLHVVVHYSNTTLVKVKSNKAILAGNTYSDSNTTLVKVKLLINLFRLRENPKFKYNSC